MHQKEQLQGDLKKIKIQQSTSSIANESSLSFDTFIPKKSMGLFLGLSLEKTFTPIKRQKVADYHTSSIENNAKQ